MNNSELALGVVYEINKDEMFNAIKGGGAFLNNTPISVSPRVSLDESLLATGFPYYNFDEISSYLKILDELMKTTHGLRRMGSAAVDLAYVACGRFEAFFEYNLNVWDVAAGALIVAEAGGEVSDFKGGEEYLFGREIVAAGNILPELLVVIDKHWQ
jgi:myo-inositol-1(or 4)-monophosphatase